MLKIENVDSIVGSAIGKYKITSVKDFTNSYSFAVFDSNNGSYFRIDLMKERIDGYWQLRWSPTKYIKIADSIIRDKSLMINEIVSLVYSHRKPIK